jgi:hypothetical protein
MELLGFCFCAALFVGSIAFFDLLERAWTARGDEAISVGDKVTRHKRYDELERENRELYTVKL